MPAKINLVGERFCRLIVLREDKDKQYAYWCRCDCGNSKSIYAKSLRSGRSKSCGCLQKDLLVRRSKPSIERFIPKVQKTDNCWLWIGAQDGHGYGVFRYNGTSHKAYRVSYELFNGPIPEKLQLDHLCRNRICVNPDHLEIVTQKENIRRGFLARLQGKCVKGLHDMDPLNTYINPTTGKTRCRKCRDEYRRKYYLEKHDNCNTKKMLQ